MLKKAWNVATGWQVIENIYGPLQDGALDETWISLQNFGSAQLRGAVGGFIAGCVAGVAMGRFSPVVAGTVLGWFAGGWKNAHEVYHWNEGFETARKHWEKPSSDSELKPQ